MKYIKQILQIILLVLLNQNTILAEDDTEYYQASNGQVDPATFIGWSVYHNTCVSCHGVGSVGSEIAPDLTERVKILSPEQFRLKVLHTTIVRFTADGWRNMEDALFEEIVKQQQRDKGNLATMPRWVYNPPVKEYVQNIYRYLKTRSDGVIGTGKPGILKE